MPPVCAVHRGHGSGQIIVRGGGVTLDRVVGRRIDTFDSDPFVPLHPAEARQPLEASVRRQPMDYEFILAI